MSLDEYPSFMAQNRGSGPRVGCLLGSDAQNSTNTNTNEVVRNTNSTNVAVWYLASHLGNSFCPHEASISFFRFHRKCDVVV